MTRKEFHLNMMLLGFSQQAGDNGSIGWIRKTSSSIWIRLSIRDFVTIRLNGVKKFSAKLPESKRYSVIFTKVQELM